MSLIMQKRTLGLTLIELFISVSIIIIFSTVSLILIFNYKDSKNLKISSEELSSVIRDTQKKSITQENGLSWGIRFTNATGTNPDKYEVFSGSVYSPGSVQKFLTFRRGIKFSNPRASSTYDVVFSPIYGKPSETKIISLILSNNKKSDSFVSDIFIKSFGKIFFDEESDIFGYWHIDEDALIDVLDCSGLGKNGVINGSPSWQSASNCKSGSCLNFNPVTNDYVAVPDFKSPTDLTLEAWIYPGDNGANDSFIIGKNSSEYQLRIIGTSGSLSATSGGTTLTDASFNFYSALNRNKWYHVAYVFSDSSNTHSLYRDGVEVATGANNNSISNQPNNFWIGRNSQTNSNTFLGRIDEIRIFDRALTSSEISEDYVNLK